MKRYYILAYHHRIFSFLTLNHQLMVRDIMPITLALSPSATVSCMDSPSCFRWCGKRDDIIDLFQANILHRRLQYQSTLVAVEFFTNIILSEFLVATLWATSHPFASHNQR